MAVTVEATVGGSSSNSYATVAEAQSYMDDRRDVADWTGATGDERAQVLIMATLRLDQERYEGRRTEEEQALAFPRAGLVDEDGYTLDDDVIPGRVKKATYELALSLLAEDLFGDTGLEGFEEVTVGPLTVTPRHTRKAGELPVMVRRLLAPFLATRSTHNVRVVRG